MACREYLNANEVAPGAHQRHDVTDKDPGTRWLDGCSLPEHQPLLSMGPSAGAPCVSSPYSVSFCKIGAGVSH